MKKKTKIIIALVLILAIAVGVYFVFGRKNSNLQMYQKVYNYNQASFVINVDETINNFVEEISKNNLNANSEKENFDLFLEVKEYYSIVENQILNYGNFVTNKSCEKYVKNMNKAYSSLIKIYEDAYNYLDQTINGVNFSTLSNATKITYIKNFNNKITNIVSTYNKFMFNAGMVYVVGAKNFVEYNSYYKLKIAYYINLINNYVNLTEDNSANKSSYENNINLTLLDLNSKDMIDTYVKNATVYNALIKNLNKINLTEISENFVTNNINAYINLIEEINRETVTNFVDYVING